MSQYYQYYPSANTGGNTYARSYNRGYAPRKDKYFQYKPTIRDTGFGSAKFKDHEFARTSPDAGVQTYDDIKAYCIQNRVLWEDPDFPACDSSLYHRKPPSVWPDIQWKRPHEICSNPKLFVDGASRLDINQGILGDCWLLAAISSLTVSERLLHRVVPEKQSFKHHYAGIFRLEIWQYGRWLEVVVDDRLPTHRGKLIYMHSDEKNEFWNALLEKAYAKLNGSYEALIGGLTSEAMTDFTGGMIERHTLSKDTDDEMYDTLLKARERLSLMACSIDAEGRPLESKLSNGLIVGHAYSITDVQQIGTMSGIENLIRVRNPWGDEQEWKGAWSDGSREWSALSEREHQDLGLTFDHDGEFWMSWDDFKRSFNRMELCYLGPDTLLDDDEGNFADYARRWEGQLMEGSWRRFVNAGGCLNYTETFWTNPQYKVNIKSCDDEGKYGSIVVGLMQKNRRKALKENLTIGYIIYALGDPDCGLLGKQYFRTHSLVGRSQFINLREVSAKHKLPPGDYVIVPCTFEPNEEGDFILRVYSEKKEEVKEIDDIIVENEVEEPEPTEEEKQRALMSEEAFKRVAGADGEIDAYELMGLLNETFLPKFDFKGFSVDLCRSMVAMKDADLSGMIGFSEYQSLWRDLIICQKSFRVLDIHNNGYFKSYEFRIILSKLARAFGCPPGVRLSNTTFNVVVRRYSDNEGNVRFDDFVACIVKLKTLFKTFRDLDSDKDGFVSFAMDEFVQMTMYS